MTLNLLFIILCSWLCLIAAFSNVKIEEGASRGNNSVDSSPDSEKSAWINVEIKPPSANLQEDTTSMY